MIPTNLFRRFDDLGRITIPRAVRLNAFGKSNVEGKIMEIFYDKDGTIILKPYESEEEKDNEMC